MMVAEQSLDDLLAGFLERVPSEIKGLIYTTTEDDRSKHIGRFGYDNERGILNLSIAESGFIGNMKGRSLSINIH